MSQEQLNEYEDIERIKERIRPLVNVHTHPRQWKYIVVHHSATDMGNAKSFHEYHKNQCHMENGLAYHFVICNGNSGYDGKVEVGNRWTNQLQGGHVKSQYHNEVGIGICLVGNFQRYAPSTRQFRSMIALIEILRDQFHIPIVHIIGHREVDGAQTVCPGKKFPLRQMKQMLI